MSNCTWVELKTSTKDLVVKFFNRSLNQMFEDDARSMDFEDDMDNKEIAPNRIAG